MSKKNNQIEFIRWFGPLLDALRDLGDSGKPQEVSQRIASNLRLNDQIIDEILKSGVKKFHNQVAWARQYLVWEGLLDSSRYGTWKLTEKGKATKLNEEDSRLIYRRWADVHQKLRVERSEIKNNENRQEKVSDEIAQAKSINLMDVLQDLSPSGFERISKELLREHGFENVNVTGSSHDGGIDGYGILEMNPFVSFKVLFQCKRYKGSVSRSQVGDFRNAMIGRAEKGIIITTGTFTNEAIKEASREGAPQIELVDGSKLIEMFEKVELGLIPKTIYEVDMNYFKKFMD